MRWNIASEERFSPLSHGHGLKAKCGEVSEDAARCGNKTLQGHTKCPFTFIECNIDKVCTIIWMPMLLSEEMGGSSSLLSPCVTILVG